MKVYISNYRNHWLSGFTIMKKVLFWKTEDEIYDTEPPKWLTSLCQHLAGFLDKIHPRIEYVKIDNFDVWSMDHTLGMIILPMLIKLKEQKHGAPGVDDIDVPEGLRSTSAPEKENEWDTDANWQLRWDWALDEMIWAFTQYSIEWDEQYKTGMADIQWKKLDNGNSEMINGPNHTREYDWDGMAKHQKRMSNGFRLMGTYYQGLWD